MNPDDLKQAVARGICAECCAARGEPPCWSPDVAGGLHPTCDCVNFAQAALDAIAAQGRTIVPNEPTEAMAQAGNYVGYDRMCPPVDVYRAMLQAAKGADINPAKTVGPISLDEMRKYLDEHPGPSNICDGTMVLYEFEGKDDG